MVSNTTRIKMLNLQNKLSRHFFGVVLGIIDVAFFLFLSKETNKKLMRVTYLEM